MKTITDEQEKKCVLKLLIEFDRICRENKIEYSLAGGTLLGAVRHKGFIPWDDDGDVLVTRENYEKIKSIFKNINDSNFGFMDENSEGYYYPFAKFYDKHTFLKTLIPIDKDIKDLGVFLDIFPIDKLPDSKQELLFFSKKINGLYKNMFNTLPGYYSLSQSKVKHLIKLIALYPKYLKIKSKGNTKQYQAKVLDELKKYNSTNMKHGGYILSEYSTRECIDIDTFNEYIDISFEGHKFRAMKNYTTYLESLYHDYMSLPPESDRHPKHAYVAYWRQ